MLNEVIIVAVSSASVRVGQTARSIVRLSGAQCRQAMDGVVLTECPPQANAVVPCRVCVKPGLEIDGMAYYFQSPKSYTGEDMVEIHLWAAADVVEHLLRRLCNSGKHEPLCDGRPPVRLAKPGEFTLRAYLNGKMDLTQAEAVAQIVASANSFQLAAAEKLLRGRFSETIAAVRAEILEVLGLIEAGLDFSEEDIEFIPRPAAAARIAAQRDRLQGLLDGSVRLERMIDLDAVGLAGLPNAGKSSLLNALLQTTRSIVSPTEATTRDILTGVLELDGLSCVLFDCAGLLPDRDNRDPLDQLAHQTALDALRRAAVVVFCIDAGKPTFQADWHVLSQIQAETIIPVAAKADTVNAAGLEPFLTQAQPCFDSPFCITSAHTGQGLAALKSRIKNALISGRDRTEHDDRLTLNRRHAERIEEAVKTAAQAADEINAGREELAAMLLRQSYATLGGLEREDVSEKILDGIFSRFCIGK